MTSRRSSGSSAAERAVEPTRSQNITVSCRRSTAEAGAAWSAGAVGAGRSASRKAAIAASNLRRCPTRLTPRSFRSSAVSSGNTAASIALSRNASSYCSNPRSRSHAAMSTLALPTRSLPLSFTLTQTTPACEYSGAVCHSPSSAVGSCCDSCSNSPLAAREDRAMLTPSASPLPFQLLQRTLDPFRASARKCLIRSIGSWHCCPAAVLDDQPSVPSRGLLELRQFCWRIGLRVEFLDTDRCEHVNDCSFRSLFRHSLRSAAERPSENRETEH